MKRKIIAITGARSEYDLLYSVYEKLNNDDRIDFGIIVTGAHLSEKYGLFLKEYSVLLPLLSWFYLVKCLHLLLSGDLLLLH